MGMQIEFSVSKAFSVPGIPDSVTATGLEKPTPFTPKRVDGYQFRKETLSDVLAWMRISKHLPDGLYLTGPTGSGKSSIICQVASRLNLPVQRVTGHSRMEMPELVGHHIVLDGDLVWQDGPLTTAMRYGHIFLLDEIDLLDPATAAGLNGVLEGAPLNIPENGGELVHPHEDFRFVATGNTAGGGDQNGLYQGTLQQNLAFMDRMWVLEVGYPTPEQEEAILAALVPSLPADFRPKMIGVANDVRKLFMGENGSGGSIEVTFSTRTLIRWATLLMFFSGKPGGDMNPMTYSLDRALANRATPDTKTVLHEICQRVFN